MEKEINIYDKKTYYYDLPEKLIAQTPIEPRDHSRMLVYNRTNKSIEHKHFYDIIDYLKNGRPITDCENIFVVHNAPYKGKPFISTLGHNFNKALKRAGIPREEEKRTGWHSLRHSLATNLLQNNVEVTTISDILGHSDPQVAKHYLRVETDGLRKCALEVEVADYVNE